MYLYEPSKSITSSLSHFRISNLHCTFFLVVQTDTLQRYIVQAVHHSTTSSKTSNFCPPTTMFSNKKKGESSKNQKRRENTTPEPNLRDEDTGRASASKSTSKSTSRRISQQPGSQGRSHESRHAAQEPQTPTRPSRRPHMSATTASPTKASTKESPGPSTEAAHRNFQGRDMSGVSNTANVDSSEDEMREPQTLKERTDEKARDAHFGIAKTPFRASDEPARVDPRPLDAGKYASQGRSEGRVETPRSPTNSGKAAVPSYSRYQGPPSPTKRGQRSDKGKEPVQVPADRLRDREREKRKAGQPSPTKAETSKDPRIAREEQMATDFERKTGLNYYEHREALGEGPVQAPSDVTLRAPATLKRSEKSGQRSQPRAPETPHKQTERGTERQSAVKGPRDAPPPSYRAPAPQEMTPEYRREKPQGPRGPRQGREPHLTTYEEEVPQQVLLQRAYEQASGPHGSGPGRSQPNFPSQARSHDFGGLDQLAPPQRSAREGWTASQLNEQWERGQPVERTWNVLNQPEQPPANVQRMTVQESRQKSKGSDCCSIQ